MTLDEIREWYEANKIHTVYQGHWCRTCSVGALLEELERVTRTTRTVSLWLISKGGDE